MELEQKYKDLQQRLTELGRVIVAYSGGVDSTFLLKAAVETLGTEKVLAIIGVSPSLSTAQHEQAAQWAELIGVELVEASVLELEDERYTANKADRCFHCKSHLYTLLAQVGVKRGFNKIVCGSNYDDQDDFRPGNRAAIKLGVHSPMMDAQLTKPDIRQLSRQYGLPTADLPASPCLASRMTYGLEVTVERLKQVEQAEAFLKDLGLIELRVRHHDAVARIEVHPNDFARVTEDETRQRILDAFKEIGFKFVALDLQGFRSGSLNEALSTELKDKHR
jgi:pyridinium-3,5-biscarboxylic acid mononucleotide sulfurtransferase